MQDDWAKVCSGVRMYIAVLCCIENWHEETPFGVALGNGTSPRT